MPTIRQIAEYLEISATTNRKAAPRTLKIVKPDISAIEYIVENAAPGQIVHIAEEDYYNPHLWRSYAGAWALNWGGGC